MSIRSGQEKIVIFVDLARLPSGLSLSRLEIRDPIHEDRHVGRLHENLPQRASDIRGGQRGRGDLVEERLEKVVVCAVDQDHLEPVIVGKPAGTLQTSEAPADDQNTLWGGHRVA